MKKDMKKLLVIVMALMPSLSIVAYAQEKGGALDPDDRPIQSIPGPHNPGPRIMMQGIDPDEIPIKQPSDPTPRPRIMSAGGTDDNSGGPIDLGLGGVRPRSGGDHVEEEKNQSVELKLENPRPRGDDGGYDDGGDDGGGDDGGNYGEPLINLHNGGDIPRSVTDVPDCYVSGGVVYFEADPSITYMEATVTSLTNILAVTASAAPDSYTIGLTLSDGTYYTGEYTIE